jgi:hypothetical protein
MAAPTTKLCEPIGMRFGTRVVAASVVASETAVEPTARNQCSTVAVVATAAPTFTVVTLTRSIRMPLLCRLAVAAGA